MSTNNKKQVVLIVLDGWGYREETKDNAIASAHKPYFDSLWRDYPHTLLEASGLAVGLPEGQMGNSEIGHTTIGAGKVIDTDLVRIGKSIDDKSFHTNLVLQNLFNHVNEHNSVLHVQGLIGDGGVHSHSKHLFAFLEAAKEAGVKKVAIHVFTDGRDTPPQSAAKYLKEVEDKIEELGIGFIATASGRFFAMDRDNNWERIEKAEDALFECKGKVCYLKKPSMYMTELYGSGVLDEHLEPLVFTEPGDETYKIKPNDGVFFFNFRADRSRQITQRILDRAEQSNINVVTLTEYDKKFKSSVVFSPPVIETTLAKEVSLANYTQAHIAETEKFPHATYFLDGGINEPYPNERYVLLDSRKDVATHDLAPRMRAEAIADKAVDEVRSGTNFIFINFANPDMVGHTANVPAIIEAIEEVDRHLGRVIDAVLECGATAIVTADHGNAELNIDPHTGEKHTAHTTNPVPCIFTQKNIHLRSGGSLADLAPTCLAVLGISKPSAMTGRPLQEVD